MGGVAAQDSLPDLEEGKRDRRQSATRNLLLVILHEWLVTPQLLLVIAHSLLVILGRLLRAD